MFRMPNTAITMKKDDMWAKVGKKHYMHVSGIEIKYDCNSWLWRIDGKEGYSTLWAAKYYAEKLSK
jgi:hypothetical protein